jgi:hypothetical protein
MVFIAVGSCISSDQGDIHKTTQNCLQQMGLSLRIVSKISGADSKNDYYCALVRVFKDINGNMVWKDYAIREGDYIGMPEIMMVNGKMRRVDLSTKCKALKIYRIDQDATNGRELMWCLLYEDPCSCRRILVDFNAGGKSRLVPQ